MLRGGREGQSDLLYTYLLAVLVCRCAEADGGSMHEEERLAFFTGHMAPSEWQRGTGASV
jgi:hypothetical protein